MLFIGSVFVFFSGFVYFLFMSAWLNMFMLFGQMQYVTFVAGLVAIGIAIVNIKDYFAFKKGVSLSIPDSAKPKLIQRMRNIVNADNMLTMFVGTLPGHLTGCGPNYQFGCSKKRLIHQTTNSGR